LTTTTLPPVSSETYTRIAEATGLDADDGDGEADSEGVDDRLHAASNTTVLAAATLIRQRRCSGSIIDRNDTASTRRA
jgi:hypothetical protein